MDSFSLQDDIFELCRSSTELLSIFGITDNDDQLNERIRREECPVELLTTDSLPFLSLVFINAHPTRNYLVNTGVLEMNIYSSTRYDAMQIYRIVKGLLQSREDFAIHAEGQVPSGIVGIYQYRVRFSPLVSA